MKVTVAILLVGAALGTLDILTPDGQRVGIIREGPGNTVDVFDKDSRRTGWGRRNADGSVELFAPNGERLGTVTRDGAIRLRCPLQKDGKKR